MLSCKSAKLRKAIRSFVGTVYCTFTLIIIVAICTHIYWYDKQSMSYVILGLDHQTINSYYQVKSC